MECPRCGLLMAVRQAGGMECPRCGEVVGAIETVRPNRAAVFLGLAPVVVKVEVSVPVEPEPAVVERPRRR